MFRKTSTLLILLFLVLMPTASYAVSFTVRVIYFLPINTSAAPNVDAKIDRLVKSAQKFFANEMERHGYGRKTFTLETNAKGKIVVHRVKGRFSRTYYQTISRTKPELPRQFVSQNNISLIFLEGNQFHELLENKFCGKGGDWINGLNFYSGIALVPASGHCFNTSTIAHELGHTFGLRHNFENHRYLMGIGNDLLAPCEVEWLSEHHYFNKTKILNNAPKVTRRYEPQAELDNKIRLKVALEDPDGLHYAHFYVTDNLELIGYQSLNGKRDMAEVVVRRSKLRYHKELYLQAMDLNGNYYIHSIPIRSLPESIDPEPIVREKSPPQTPDFSHLKNIDVDGNGLVNIADLDIVISNLGKNIEEDADTNPDVNRDGVVTQADVDLIIKQLNVAAAPTTPKVPERTQLLPNYPNPFNPDTWIPFQLATDSNVQIRICTAKGVVVQTLQLGNQAPGMYQSRSRAAYWDGKNAVGEPVASGVYFYTLTAGDFTATRKMLIRK